MFKQYISHLRVDESVSLEVLADATPNYSGHDIHDICMEAQMKVVRELFESGQTGPGTKPRPITMDDLLEIIRTRRSSISMETIAKIESWSKMHMAL